ncbi:MAG TPA: potassium-transporting ATPase subunit KdpC [Thermoanaerobaculia bacterium]|nr:potassium-transporting ATPase subunit KdpC [Thermoanaerobaculia bacterium]
MKSNLRPALAFVILFTLVCGLAYPLAVTGLARLFFPEQASGSLERNAQGAAMGSDLIGQNFTSPRYFWGRPSAANYDGAASTGSNLGPTNPALVGPEGTIARRVQELRSTGVPNLPVDLVTSSASGLDPDITPAAAYYQVDRVAVARGLSPSVVRDLVTAHVVGPQWGFLGPARVNVLALNRALDRLAP